MPTSEYFIKQDNGRWEKYGISRDIPKRKRVEEALQESEEYLRIDG
jgi:hypothetical protein